MADSKKTDAPVGRFAAFKRLPFYAKLFAVAFLVMSASEYFLLSYVWDTRLDYTFGYLVPIFSLYVIYDRSDKMLGILRPASIGETEGVFARGFADLFFGSMLFCGLVFYLFFAWFFYMTQNRGAPAFSMTFGFSFASYAMAYFASARSVDGSPFPLKSRLQFTALFTFPCFIWILSAPPIGTVEEKISLSLDAPAAPSLTLDPLGDAAAAEKEAEQPKVEPVTVEDTPLTPEEQKMVDDFAEKIDITNSQIVLQYGAASQKKISDFSEAALDKVRTKDMGEVGDMLTSLVTELQNFDALEELLKGAGGEAAEEQHHPFAHAKAQVCPRHGIGTALLLVQPVHTRDHTDHGGGPAVTGKLTQKLLFRSRFRPARIHDKDKAVRTETFLKGKHVLHRIGGIEPGGIHQHHAVTQDVRRKFHIHAGGKKALLFLGGKKGAFFANAFKQGEL